jgi:NMD protein affecting ribosome stability and mRNA decay
MLDELMVSPTDSGTYIFLCAKCRALPEYAFGAKNKGELVYILVCSNCTHILGQWATIEERDRELREFAKKISSKT